MSVPYPQSPYAPPPPAPTPAPAPADPGRVPRLLAAILGLLEAALVVVGSFLPQT